MLEKTQILKHDLLETNSSTRLGVCRVCGPVTITKHGKGVDGQQRWKCSVSKQMAKQKQKPPRHLISDLNLDIMTCHCANCGPVKLSKAGIQDDGAQRYRCYNAVKRHAIQKHTDMAPKEHFLSDINEAAMTATCAKCGSVTIKRKNVVRGKMYYGCCGYVVVVTPAQQRRLWRSTTKKEGS